MSEIRSGPGSIVLVSAEDETQAQQLGRAALHELYADLRERLGKEVPIDIRTVREAKYAEIDLRTWHHNMLATEMQTKEIIPRPGDRIRLLSMRDDPDPIPSGQLGTVVDVRRYDDAGGLWHQIDVASVPGL